MFKLFQGRSGFTLVEMLIVIIVLGILAMIVVPQVAVSTEDAKLKTLQTNLSILRDAIDIYSAQHNQTYPGAHEKNGTTNPDDNKAADAFEAQLTQYTDIDGRVNKKKDTTFKYGPYIKGGALPTNPFDGANTVLCDVNENDITVKAQSGTASWKFYPGTGNLLANDGGTTEGTVHEDL